MLRSSPVHFFNARIKALGGKSEISLSNSNLLGLDEHLSLLSRLKSRISLPVTFVSKELLAYMAITIKLWRMVESKIKNARIFVLELMWM